MALILAAFYLLVNDNSVARLPSRPFLAGICLGLAIYLRLESVIFVLAAGLAMILWGTTAPGTWVQRLGGLVKQRAAFGIGLLLAVTPLFLFNGLVEGHWLGRRYASDVAAALERAADPSSSWAMRLLPALAVGGTDHNGVTLQPLLAWLFVLAWGLMLAAPWLLRRGWAVPAFVAGFTLVGLSGLALVDPTPYASVHGLVLIAPAISFGTWALVVLRCAHPALGLAGGDQSAGLSALFPAGGLARPGRAAMGAALCPAPLSGVDHRRHPGAVRSTAGRGMRPPGSPDGSCWAWPLW